MNPRSPVKFMMKILALTSVVSLLSLGFVAAIPTTTSSAVAAAGSQIRTDQDPVYHLYIQSTPVGMEFFSENLILSCVYRTQRNLSTCFFK